METLHYILRFLAVSQVLLLILYLLIYHHSTVARIMALALFSFACYLISPYVYHVLQAHRLMLFLGLFGTSIPAFLWLLGRWFFTDKLEVGLWFWLLWAGYVSLWLIGRLQLAALNLSDVSNYVWFELLPQIVKLGLVAHVIYMALEGRANDLVAKRLQLRVPVAIGASVLTLVVILAEVSTLGEVPLVTELLGSLLMLVATTGQNIWLFRLRDDLPLSPPQQIEPISSTAAKQPVNEQNQYIDKITALMEQQRFYANHGVTITDLAQALDMPEYKLRSTINQHLGYRNFNQFLNHHRINEASRRLLAQAQLPIVSIALDIGFKSLSSFNKAFKERHQMTPTAYRQTAEQT